MYAVIKVGGHQYKVSPGEALTVDLQPGKVGETLEFPALLVVDDKRHVLVGKDAGSTKVALTIAAETKGEKVHIRRYWSKSRHHRHIGFRSRLTSVVVASVGGKAKTPAKTVKKTE